MPHLFVNRPWHDRRKGAPTQPPPATHHRERQQQAGRDHRPAPAWLRLHKLWRVELVLLDPAIPIFDVEPLYRGTIGHVGQPEAVSRAFRPPHFGQRHLAYQVAPGQLKHAVFDPHLYAVRACRVAIEIVDRQLGMVGDRWRSALATRRSARGVVVFMHVLP